LLRRCNANRIGETNTVHPNIHERAVHFQDIIKVASEGILAAEPHLDIVFQRELDHLDCSLNHLRDALLV
jgi:hypothetical protein